jgi:hypothetical protein
MADSKHDTANAVGKFCLSGLATGIIRYISITCPAFLHLMNEASEVCNYVVHCCASSH